MSEQSDDTEIARIEMLEARAAYMLASNKVSQLRCNVEDAVAEADVASNKYMEADRAYGLALKIARERGKR